MSQPNLRNEMTRSASRREFMVAASAATAGLAMGAEAPKPPMDSPRELMATGADLGSLFADVTKLADANAYSLAYSSGKFKSVAEFTQTARVKVLDVLQYRPDKV